MVVGETRAAAQDAAELVEVEYEVLPAVVDLATAIKGDTLLHPDRPHNLVVDFLANHPELLRTPGTIRGVATGLLYFVLTLGEALGTGDFWGEATDQSAAFYRRQFRAMEITDRFVLPPAEQWHFLEKTRTKWKESGLALNLGLD